MQTHLARHLFPVLIFVTLIAALMPWAVSVLRTPLHSDLVWLYEGFVRLVSGQHMADSIFEPNPPLSLFTYAIPYYLTTLTGLPSWMTIFSYVMGLLALGSCVVKYVVTKITGPNSYAPWLITAAYIVSQTIMTMTLYGERDHLIGIVLVPFVLLQYALTKNIVISKNLQWPVFLIGAVVILLKPHHGLIPFFMIVHRFLKQKNLRFIKDADFLSLTVMVLAYATVLLMGFSDYRSIIFPDVVQLYLTNHSPDILKLTGMLLIPGFIVLAGAHPLRYKIRHGELIAFMALCAIASLIPFFVQGKGFFYHLFPAFGFFIPAFFMLLAGLLEHEVKSAKTTLLLTLSALLGIVYVIFPTNTKLPTYDDYLDMPLTRIISENCRNVPNCSFMMFNNTMGITHETAYVTGLTHGSRFPSYWFLPEMLKKEHALPGSMDMRRLAYADRVGEDLENYQPRTLIIGRFQPEGYSEGKFFDFGAYWAVSESFRRAWEKYEHTGTMDIAYSDYYPGTIIGQDKPVTYDIYRLKKGNQ